MIKKKSLPFDSDEKTETKPQKNARISYAVRSYSCETKHRSVYYTSASSLNRTQEKVANAMSSVTAVLSLSFHSHQYWSVHEYYDSILLRQVTHGRIAYYV